MRLVCAVIVSAAAVLGGCNQTSKFGEPSAITLENALNSVGDGLATLRAHDLKTGLIVTEVDVVFNITANAKDNRDGKMYVEVGGKVADVVDIAKAGSNLGFTSEIYATRGNTITVKFRNILAQSTKDTVAGKLTDAQVEHLASNIETFGRLRNQLLETDVGLKRIELERQKLELKQATLRANLGEVR